MRSERFRPRLVLAAALSLGVAGCAASTQTQAQAQTQTQTEAQSSESAAAQSDRTDPATLVATGEPRRCISSRNNVQTRASGETVLMFRSGANSWFRNDLRGSCPVLNRDRTLIFRSVGSQYCEMDMFEVVDPISRISFGTCMLGRFTPVDVPRGTNF